MPDGKKKNKDPKGKKEKPIQAAERDKTESGSSRKGKIKWPRGDSKEWEKLDSDLSELLKYIFSTPEKKAISHPKIIYEFCKERFGTQEKTNKETKQGPSRRQRKCVKLREEINILKRTYLEAPEKEKPAINELQAEKIK